MIAVHEQQDPAGQYVMWSGTTEGESFDRTHLRLPGSQEELIKVPLMPCLQAHAEMQMHAYFLWGPA